MWPSRVWRQGTLTNRGETSCLRPPSWGSLITPTSSGWRVWSLNVSERHVVKTYQQTVSVYCSCPSLTEACDVWAAPRSEKLLHHRGNTSEIELCKFVTIHLSHIHLFTPHDCAWPIRASLCWCRWHRHRYGSKESLFILVLAPLFQSLHVISAYLSSVRIEIPSSQGFAFYRLWQP